MNIVEWLLHGDISIKYQTYRDLLEQEKPHLKEKIAYKGYAKKILELQKINGHWSEGYYQYKWVCTHYTLLELRRLEINNYGSVDNIIYELLENYKTKDGGITANPHLWEFSDICLNGMLLFVFCYFKVEEQHLVSMMDRILSEQMSDGGFNCDYPRHNPTHSSLHSTISIIEGMNEYINNGYIYRIDEVKEARHKAFEFILMHRLYKSDKTGEIINSNFVKLSYPPRYKYDILRALEAFRIARYPYDERMEDAIQLILDKRRKDGTWPVQHKHPGRVHFDMEKIGGPSRWNTLRVLRVLKFYKHELFENIIKEIIIV